MWAKLFARDSMQIREKINALLATADQGRIFREGVRVVIYGATNAGKSSLLNRLLGFPRAIVSEIPGTTRDTIEEVVNLRGIALRLTDTAGLRDGETGPDRAGRDRAHGRARSRRPILFFIWSMRAWRSRNNFARRSSNARRDAELLLLNKMRSAGTSAIGEIAMRCGFPALTENGLAGLEEKILAKVSEQRWDVPSAVAINARHRDCLRRALEALRSRASAALAENLAPELVAADLRETLHAVGEVIGHADMEEILDSLFATFCIGK